MTASKKTVSKCTQMGKPAQLQSWYKKYQMFYAYPFVCFEQSYILNFQKDQGHFQPITDC